MKFVVIFCAYLLIKSINPSIAQEYDQAFVNLAICSVIFDTIKYIIETINKKNDKQL